MEILHISTLSTLSTNLVPKHHSREHAWKKDIFLPVGNMFIHISNLYGYILLIENSCSGHGKGGRTLVGVPQPEIGPHPAGRGVTTV